MSRTEMWALFWAYVLGMAAVIFGIKYVFLLFFWLVIKMLEFLAWFMPRVGL